MADTQNSDNQSVSPPDTSSTSISSSPSDSISQPSESADSDTNRPITPNLADSPNDLADSSGVSADSSLPADSTSQPDSANSPVETTPSNIEEKPPESPVDPSDINISPPGNQTPQVQSESTDMTSTNNPESAPIQSAEIKPEVPESPAIPSTPPFDNSSSGPTVSFGDLLSSDNQVSSSFPIPSAPSPQPVASDQSPKAEIPSPTPIKTPPQVLPNTEQTASESVVIEKIVEKPVEVIKEVVKEVPVEVVKEVVKEIPVINQGEIERQAVQKIKDEQTSRRALANRARTKRKDDNLAKIMELVKAKGKIKNKDVRDYLHVSQSTATDYLSELVSKGLLKINKRAKSTFYTL